MKFKSKLQRRKDWTKYGAIFAILVLLLDQTGWRGNAIDFSNNIYSSIGRVFGTIVGGAFFGLIAASITNLFLKTNTHID